MHAHMHVAHARAHVQCTGHMPCCGARARARVRVRGGVRVRVRVRVRARLEGRGVEVEHMAELPVTVPTQG